MLRAVFFLFFAAADFQHFIVICVESTGAAYIPTDEGWLYLAAVMDLCGRKIVGISMDSRMTKQFTIDALKDAVNHSDNVNGCILHSDYTEFRIVAIWVVSTVHMTITMIFFH